MSQEQKPPEKSLADQRVDKILTRIEELKKEMEQYKPPIKTETHSHDESRHFQASDLENVSCPNCKKNVDELKQKWGEEYADAHVLEKAQKLYKDRAVHSHKCTNCQLGVSDEELKDKDRGCVLCGNKQAR